jgi:hypothetical protein
MITGDAAPSNALSAHIESPPGVSVSSVTVSCSEPCADLLAVAKGGAPPYSFRWEDGSTDAARHVCPTSTTSYAVTVTDTGVVSGEFRSDPQSVSVPLTANVLDCSQRALDAGSGGTGGELSRDGGSVGTTVFWTSWTTVTPGTPGSATGAITAPGGDVQVTYSGELGAPSETQSGMTNHWAPASTYTSPTVTNGPPDAGMLAVSGGAGLTETITFSTPARDPVIAIWSVGFGSLGLSSTWTFDAAPKLLSSGPSSSWPFVTPITISGNSVTCTEGNGVLGFTGTFTSISFTIPTPEPAPGYGGLTVGIRGSG